MANGSAKRAEFEEQDGEDQEDRHEQDDHQVAEGLPLLLVEAAVLDDPSRDRCVPAQNVADLGHGAAHVPAFEPGRDGDVLPRIFAPELELAGLFLDIDRLRELDERPVRRSQRQLAQAGQPVDVRWIDLDPDGDHPVALEDGGGRLAQHRGVGDRRDVVRRQAEPLRVGEPQAKADRRPGVNQAVEDVHDARDLFDRLRDLRRLFLEPALIGGKQFHFDRLGGPHRDPRSSRPGCRGIPRSDRAARC